MAIKASDLVILFLVLVCRRQHSLLFALVLGMVGIELIHKPVWWENCLPKVTQNECCLHFAGDFQRSVRAALCKREEFLVLQKLGHKSDESLNVRGLESDHYHLLATPLAQPRSCFSLLLYTTQNTSQPGKRSN